jgi:hypothetical protein
MHSFLAAHYSCLCLVLNFHGDVPLLSVALAMGVVLALLGLATAIFSQ